MYEKEVDCGDIGAQWAMAREIFKKDKPAASAPVAQTGDDAPGGMRASVVNRLVAEGALKFKDHEDVMSKLTGVK